MPGLTGPIQVFSADIFSSDSSAKHSLGTEGITRDGRRFRYVQAGGSALVVGNLLQAPAQIANHQQMTPTATALGAVAINVTPGATAGAANLYAEGLAIIDTTPGLGYAYPVDRHAAITASTAFDLYLPSDSPIQVALTTSSRVSLQVNPCKNVIQTPTTLTAAVIGAAVYPIAAGEFGWVQTRGPAGVLIQGTPAVGNALSVSGTVAGAAAINSGTLPIIGNVLVTGVDTKVQAVFLNIA